MVKDNKTNLPIAANQWSDAQFFEGKEVRRVVIEETGEVFFSVVDMVARATEQQNYLTNKNYWRKLKQRIKEEKEEKNESVTICHTLKMVARDGKLRETDVANTEQIFRIMQSIPGKRTEKIKLWLAKLGKEKIDEMNGVNKTTKVCDKHCNRLNIADLQKVLNAIETIQECNVNDINHLEIYDKLLDYQIKDSRRINDIDIRLRKLELERR